VGGTRPEPEATPTKGPKEETSWLRSSLDYNLLVFQWSMEHTRGGDYSHISQLVLLSASP
jgi:hypothetical protein